MNLHPYEMVSEESYLALEWWSSFVTDQVTSKGVNFTVVVLMDSCYNATTRGADYAGDHTYTETFEECLPWADTTDCTDFPSDTVDTFWLMDAGNKCRNPNGKLSQPWCYTFKNGTNCHKRYCDVCNHMTTTDTIKHCASLIATQPDFCNTSMSRFGCFKTCNMRQPVYNPVSCGTPPVPSDGELVGSTANSTYRQGSMFLYGV
ncbi:metalloendopeptidase [Plakobranchus ocellatus]|uniref:Metalloendopeptidase n=1 Tax=Plakobranchus ocellatus TaxID=259542 RepID=A0AAV4BYF9_9GAST|nr:metalloendopeptidase [Plakobranchus ocellatus]